MKIVLLIIIFLLLLYLFLQYAAELLIKKDDIECCKNSVIVLLMGSVGDRSLGAADLYNNGKAEKIIMADSSGPGVDILREKMVSVETIAERSRYILEELGVNKEDIVILSGSTKNTKDEAIVIRTYLETTPDEIDSIVLVTSKYHSFRSNFIFKQTLHKSDINIYSVPTEYDPFSAKNWYRNRSNTKIVFVEYLKLMYFLLIDWVQVRR